MFESITRMQHLPSLLFLLCLFFLQVHQTNTPATASAATDPNTAPTTIPMVPTMCDKLQIIFLWSGNIWNSVRTQFIFFLQFCVSQFITLAYIIGINFKVWRETLERSISTQIMLTVVKHENEAEKRHTLQLHTWNSTGCNV